MFLKPTHRHFYTKPFPTLDTYPDYVISRLPTILEHENYFFSLTGRRYSNINKSFTGYYKCANLNCEKVLCKRIFDNGIGEVRVHYKNDLNHTCHNVHNVHMS